MDNYQAKLQTLLRELFQFDCAELDFGIYRIMNYKRKAIEDFISKDLIEVVSAELDKGALAEQSQAAQKLKRLQKQIKETLGEEAIDAEGNLAEQFAKTKIGKEYRELKSQATGAKNRSALEALIFNHLYSFFSRYYDSGDFMSKRRYSKREKYAIPYNGEEVHLHWANSDQYYIKTDEYFRDYSFRSQGITVHFKLQNADIEKDNVKGDKRYFIPKCNEIVYHKKAKEIIIPFEHRPLTEQEDISYGKKNQQEKIIAEAMEEIPKKLKDDKALASLVAERRKTSEGKSVSYLEHHLRQYTRRNTSDFFIHKNLKGFLEKELDFYLKNEVLNVDELEAAGKHLSQGWFQTMLVIKNIGHKIIAFLAQIENFQKKLFEKKKFVTETQYCITVSNVPEKFYRKIAENDKQWAEWKELFHIDEEQKNLFNANAKTKKEKRVAFLKAHPTLVLDTKHFNASFVDKLLASFEDIDEATDGLLIHGENYQALSLLMEKYHGKVECVYIDPPYNTDASSILYKNDYKHSSWLSMVSGRVLLAHGLLADNGILCVAIDDEEAAVLLLLLENIFGREIGIATVRSNPAGRKTTGKLAPAHEYAMFFGKSHKSVPGSLERPEERLSRYPLKDSKGRYAWANFIRSGSGDRRSDRPTMFYPVYVSKNDSIRIPKMEWDSENRSFVVLEKPASGEVAVWPIVVQDQGKIEKRWHRGHERVINEPDEFRIRRVSGGAISIDFKTRMDEDAIPTTWWDNKLYASANYGAAELKELFGYKPFDFAKATGLVRDCVSVCTGTETKPLVLDFFAGSGTTGHAVINLNREDGGNRKVFLAEMGQYYDTVLLPRIKKATFTPEWKDGKPKRMATKQEAERSPRIIKYQRIESYEDALNNIAFEDGQGQTKLMKFDDYLLNYMLAFETKGSDTFLNIEKLASPFSYKLNITEGQETKEKLVDLPETFNYLLGLHVKSRKVYDDKGRKYLVCCGTVDHREVVVIWRETKGWEKKDLERDKKFVADNKLAEGADEVFVNGDSFIPKARALDTVFKARMFEVV